MVAVRNLPVELNSITSLDSHFSKFGVLVNIQIHFEGDPCSALLTFVDADEAAAAINSTEAIMNNRFIKVFKHNEKQALKVKERLGKKATPTREELDAELEKYQNAAKNKTVASPE